MEKVEVLVIKNLLYNEEYGRKVIPFIKSDYLKIKVKGSFEEISLYISIMSFLLRKHLLLR